MQLGTSNSEVIEALQRESDENFGALQKIAAIVTSGVKTPTAKVNEIEALLLAHGLDL